MKGDNNESENSARSTLLAASLIRIADDLEEVAHELDETCTTDGCIFYTRKVMRAVQGAIRKEAFRINEKGE